MRSPLSREWLIDEVLMLLPVLGRGLRRPARSEFNDMARLGALMDAQLSAAHVQVLFALEKGPRSVGALAEAIGVSRSVASQLVDRLVEHGLVKRRHDPEDHLVVLVEYAPGMQDMAHRMMEWRRRRLKKAVNSLTDEEARAS